MQTDEQFDEIGKRIDERFDAMNRRLERIADRLDALADDMESVQRTILFGSTAMSLAFIAASLVVLAQA